MVVAQADGMGVADVGATVEAKDPAQEADVDRGLVGTAGTHQGAQEVGAHLPKAVGRVHQITEE